MSAASRGFPLLATLLLGGTLPLALGCDSPVPPPSAPLPVLRALEPYPLVSECEGATILVSEPRRADDPNAWTCTEAYEVDFVVEGSPADAMLLDMFQTHTLRGWRVEAYGERVRHEFTLRMEPYWMTVTGIGLGSRKGLFGHEPIVVQSCAEGEGTGEVLACTTTGCGVYEDVSLVPPLMPLDLELAITVPSEFHYLIPIREGETVEIPLTFRIFRPLPKDTGVVLEVNDPVLREVADIEITPAELVLRAGSSRTETRVARLTVRRNDAGRNWKLPLEFAVHLKPSNVSLWSVGSRCINPPPHVLVFWLHSYDR